MQSATPVAAVTTIFCHAGERQEVGHQHRLQSSKGSSVNPSVIRIGVAVVVALAVLTWAVESSNAASVRHCKAPGPNAGQGPRDDRFVPFGAVKVRGMSCSNALGAIRNGHLNPRFHTKGFSCRVVKQYQVGVPNHGGFITGQDIRCKRRSREFWWNWST